MPLAMAPTTPREYLESRLSRATPRRTLFTSYLYRTRSYISSYLSTYPRESERAFTERGKTCAEEILGRTKYRPIALVMIRRAHPVQMDIGNRELRDEQTTFIAM